MPLALLVPCFFEAATGAPAEKEQPPPVGAEVAPTDPVAKSVVKIFTVVRYPDCFKPWSKSSPTSLAGSGVVIKGKRILTNAHLVLDASEVQIQTDENTEKITGTVVGISPEMDLAVIKLSDESFFDTHSALECAKDLPAIKDAVTVYGFPIGGTSMSITKGIVSRIEFTAYHYGAMGLRIQVDAAINPGNSGGPAVVGNKMIGVAFAHLTRAENISYIIPCEEIDLFLNTLVDGACYGRPRMPVRVEVLQNPAMRSFLHLDKSVHGVLVQQNTGMLPGNPLRKWDVITEIGGTPIDDLGEVKVKGNLRVNYSYLINDTARNGKVPVTILREGQLMHLDVPVTNRPNWLIPALKGAYPSYFVYGPLVFSHASVDLVGALVAGRMASQWVNLLMIQESLLLDQSQSFCEFDGQQLVVVTAFFPHKLTQGYNDPTSQVVRSVNGIPVRNLAHLVQILRDASDPYVSIEFHGPAGSTLVFKREELVAETEAILTENNVRNQASADMMAIWNAKNK